jgi:hypothetical protein
MSEWKEDNRNLSDGKIISKELDPTREALNPSKTPITQTVRIVGEVMIKPQPPFNFRKFLRKPKESPQSVVDIRSLTKTRRN